MGIIKSSVIFTAFFDQSRRIDEITKYDAPAVSLTGVDVKGAGIMGTINIPGTGMVESMQWVVSARGRRDNVERLSRPGEHSQEIRYLQDTYDSSQPSNRLTQDIVKEFLTGIFKGNEGGSSEVGTLVETTVTYECLRIQRFVNGVETLLIDKDAQIYRVNGVDYWENIRSLLK